MKKYLISVFAFIMLLCAVCLGACATDPAPRETRYKISVEESENGTVIPSALSAYEGEQVSLEVRPDENCRLAELRRNGEAISGMTFIMPAEDVTIVSVFEKIQYAITLERPEGGTLTADKQGAAVGETVTVTAVPESGYALLQGGIFVNGEAIEGNSFEMPALDVRISAVFTKAEKFPESACSVTATAAYGTAEARWYAQYDTAGIHIAVRVKDDTITTGNGDFGYDDNVEFMIGMRSEATGLDKNLTYKFLLSAGGKFYLQKAADDTQWGAPSDLSLNIAPGSNFWYSLTEVTYEDGAGGYRADIYFGYDLLNTDAETAFGNLTIMPALRNTNGIHSTWSSSNGLGAQWAKAYTFALISGNGEFTAREY